MASGSERYGRINSTRKRAKNRLNAYKARVGQGGGGARVANGILKGNAIKALLRK